MQIQWFYRTYLKPKIEQYLPYILMLVALLSGTLLYLKVKSSEQQPLNPIFLYGSVFFIVVFLVIIVKRLIYIWIDQKRGLGGSKLHSQTLTLFALVSILPGVFVAIFASLFFNLGVQAWFGEPVKNALSESSAVINSYLKVLERDIGYQAEIGVHYLRPKLDFLKNDREAFDAELTHLEEKLGLSECMVLSKQNLRILGKSMLTFALELGRITPSDFKKAEQATWTTSVDNDRFRALALLGDDLFLLIGKTADKKILNHVRQNTEAISMYHDLEEKRSGFELTFLAVFGIITLLLLCAAIWVGLNIANRMIRPIGNLIEAAKTVSSGNLDVHVEEEHFNNELDTLIHSFNIMISQLKRQQNELMLSQKKAAWADIARKIAHEIKNPLTPIQLSAERLKRRYLKQIEQDPQTFEQCIDTIIRQVDHIGNLVREFSNFARMPEAIIEKHNLSSILKEAIDFEASAHSSIIFVKKIENDLVLFLCDAYQITQVFINLLQNSIDALLENNIKKPTIRIQLSVQNDEILVRIEDNGPGFPKTGREQLSEPYYTTREKGTGLGLAIVEKIVTDHQGALDLSDSPMGGAMVTLIFTKKV